MRSLSFTSETSSYQKKKKNPSELQRVLKRVPEGSSEIVETIPKTLKAKNKKCPKESKKNVHGKRNS